MGIHVQLCSEHNYFLIILREASAELKINTSTQYLYTSNTASQCLFLLERDNSSCMWVVVMTGNQSPFQSCLSAACIQFIVSSRCAKVYKYCL